MCLRESCLSPAPQGEAMGACMMQAGSPWRTSSAASQRRRLARSTRRSKAAQRSRQSRRRRGGHRGLSHSSPRGDAQGLRRRRTRRRGGTACCKPRCSASAAWCCHSMLLLLHINLAWCLSFICLSTSGLSRANPLVLQASEAARPVCWSTYKVLLAPAAYAPTALRMTWQPKCLGSDL